jgi:hypothetical protein
MREEEKNYKEAIGTAPSITQTFAINEVPVFRSRKIA